MVVMEQMHIPRDNMARLIIKSDKIVVEVADQFERRNITKFLQFYKGRCSKRVSKKEKQKGLYASSMWCCLSYNLGSWIYEPQA